MLGNSEFIIDDLRSTHERAKFTELSPILAESLMQNLNGKNGHRKRKRMMDNVASPDSLGWVQVTARGLEYTPKATVNLRSSIIMQLDPAVVASFIRACAGVAMLGQACVFTVLCCCVLGCMDMLYKCFRICCVHTPQMMLRVMCTRRRCNTHVCLRTGIAG